MPDFPIFSQLDQNDCGPTCLRMISKFYGKTFSLQSLRNKTQIGKEGVSLLGISEAAESLGFRTLGSKIPFEKLVNDAPLPCILHWQQNHFVVLHEIRRRAWMARIVGGFKRNSPDLKDSKNENINVETTNTDHDILCIADPAQGLVQYSRAEFCKHWISSPQPGAGEGVALFLEPTDAFHQTEDEKPTSYGFQRLLNYIFKYKSLVLQLLLGLLVGSGLQLLLPFLTQSIVDIGINTQNLSFVALVLIGQLVLLGSRLTVEFIRSRILAHISTRVNLSILSDFFIKLLKLPVSFFHSKQVGDILQRVGDHQRIESFLTGQSLNTLLSATNFLVFGVVLAFYNLYIFGVFLTGSIIYSLWITAFLKKRRELDYKNFTVAANTQNAILQMIQGMQEIKLAGAERPMRWSWEQLQIRSVKLQLKELSLTQLQQGGGFAINEGKNILITFIAAHAVIDGQLSLGGLLAVQFILGQLNGPIEQFISFVQSLQNARISLERLNEIHVLDDEEKPGLSLQDEVPSNRDLSLNNISFKYPGAGNAHVVTDINLIIPAHKTTAIVGTSGSGKTTMLKLLLRFNEPSTGNLKLGDIPLAQISHTAWRSKCGVVMQDGYIFSDTIARNIAVGADRIDIVRLDYAIHVANLDNFINDLPSGYHTRIGAEGNGISAGQKQRILIARAVYKQPDYIFFDEATNALDANNESTIMNRLKTFFEKRTVIVVAHRLSTVRFADQIVVLNNGEISEIGTHETLIARKGEYWNLIKNQLELGN